MMVQAYLNRSREQASANPEFDAAVGDIARQKDFG